MSAALFAHQETSPTAGPTPNAPSSLDMLHEPANFEGSDLTSLKFHTSPAAGSIITSILLPPSDKV